VSEQTIVEAEGVNALCPYCRKGWLYETCWICQQWTCGHGDCWQAHDDEKHGEGEGT